MAIDDYAAAGCTLMSPIPQQVQDSLQLANASDSDPPAKVSRLVFFQSLTHILPFYLPQYPAKGRIQVVEIPSPSLHLLYNPNILPSRRSL